MVGKDCLVRYVQMHLGAMSVSGDEDCSPLPYTEGEGDTCTREIYALLLGRWEMEQRALVSIAFSSKQSLWQSGIFGDAAP